MSSLWEDRRKSSGRLKAEPEDAAGGNCVEDATLIVGCLRIGSPFLRHLIPER
jgi:hypothetical protein